METKRKCCCKSRKTVSKDQAAEEYSGIAINKADGNKVTEKLVKERTETLNDNPRSDD